MHLNGKVYVYMFDNLHAVKKVIKISCSVLQPVNDSSSNYNLKRPFPLCCVIGLMTFEINSLSIRS